MLPTLSRASLAPPNLHFVSPSPPSKFTWELDFEERRKLAKDPHIQKQLDDERQFEGTNVEVIFKKVKEYAPVTSDWIMTREGFSNMCRQEGVTSDYVVRKLLGIFDKEDTGTIHGILFTKLIHVLINDPANDIFVTTAFDVFSRPIGEPDILVSYLLQDLCLKEPCTKVPSKKGKKKGKTEEVLKQGGVTYSMQQTVRICLAKYNCLNNRTVTKAEFAKWWEAEPELVGAFLATILEVIASVYDSCDLPKLPKSFLDTLVAVPSQPFSDADWWLLKEAQARGGVNIESTKKKGKKGRK